MKFVSFDVGVKSFGVFVGMVDMDTVKGMRSGYSNLPKSKKYIESAYPQSIEYITHVKDVCKSIEWVMFDIIDLRGNKSNRTQYTNDERVILIDYLYRSSPIFDDADHVTIERQLTDNIKATRMAETIHTWFMTRNYCRSIPCSVSYVPNKYKTKRLGSPNSLTYNQRKKFTVNFVKYITEKTSHIEMSAIFEIAKKRFRKRMTADKSLMFLEESGIPTDSNYYHLAKMVAYDNQKLDDCTDAFAQLVAFLMWKYVSI